MSSAIKGKQSDILRALIIGNTKKKLINNLSF